MTIDLNKHGLLDNPSNTVCFLAHKEKQSRLMEYPQTDCDGKWGGSSNVSSEPVPKGPS